MEADFSGWATKVGLKCSDGRTIMRDAFKHQDGLQVPLVWQHGHNDPENVLGHAILQNRPEGVYAYAYFNKSKKAQHAKGLVEHKDINMLSIWANQLIERAGAVLHGAIREVSLVLSGANPGAVIENVALRHSDGSGEEVLEDEAIIYTGLELEHEDKDSGTLSDTTTTTTTSTQPSKELEHMEITADTTIQEVYDSLTPEQKDVVNFMIGQAIEDATQGDMAQSAFDPTEIYTKLDQLQEGITAMGHNVFENGGQDKGVVLTHDDISSIVSNAKQSGWTLKKAVEDYALSHGITDIDVMFPDAVTIGDGTPEFLKRRTEWATMLLGAVRKSPFSRIKTFAADITLEEARAKGYVKGTMKKEEFFSVSKRSTVPTTVYKKQKLDRDDIIDITDFDVVAWLKGEMRLMLDEEIARAILLGDGRDVASDDKIDEQCIRPIVSDHELFTTTVYVNLDDANSNMQEFIDAVVRARRFYKGTGLPTMFTTETYIANLLLMKDTTGRRIYSNLAEVAAELRVSSIVGVEVMEEYRDLVAVIVNPIDYVVGASKGGEVNMFDDFDIDYNQQKYLIETRCCGALVKLKSAMVVRKTAGGNVLAVPVAPDWNAIDGEISINDTTGVVYKRADNNATVNASGSPYTVAPGSSLIINAFPASGYYFATSEEDSWTFTMPAA